MSATSETGFASAPTGRIAGIYVSVTAGALAILFVVLRLGRGKEAPLGEDAAGVEGHGSIDTHEVFWKLILAIVVVIAAARFLGAVFRRIGQPQVVGEIVAGVLLGPTLLGTVWPRAAEFVFNEDVLPFVDVFSQIGLVFFMFLVGVELDVRLIRGQGAAAALVSHTSIVVPFISGVLLALVIFSTLRSPDGDFLPFALFLGASMSVTAFPVLARILTERRLHKTRLGAVTITCAAVDDVTAWCILAVVMVLVDPTGRGTSPPPRGQIVVPFVRPAEHAVRIARQIAMTHGASIRLVSTIADQGEAARMAARHADQSGVLARSEVMEEETIEALLSTGEGADLVVLPLGGGAESMVGRGRAWSTTPVLVLRDAATPPDVAPQAIDPDDVAVPEVVS